MVTVFDPFPIRSENIIKSVEAHLNINEILFYKLILCVLL